MNKHGSWSVNILPYHVIGSRPVGSFSVQSIANYCEDIRQAVLTFQGLSWIHIIDAREFGLAVPEALSVAQQENDWAIAHGRTLKVFFVKNALQEYQLSKVITDLHPTLYFHSVDELVETLSERLHTIDSGSIRRWLNTSA